MLPRVTLLAVLLSAIISAQQPELPRFRAGANLVRADVYVSKDGVAVTDLKAEDFALFEDDKPQQIESFQLVQARGPNPQSERTNPTNVRDMEQELRDAARVFTLFFDNLRVSLPGSYHAQKPIVELLDRVIGPDDVIGVMTPQISPSSVTYSRRTSSVERLVTEHWAWGKRDSVQRYHTDQETALVSCYGEQAAWPFILRMREEETLEALEALIGHLDALRPERKFVLLFTEGWALHRPDASLLERLPGGARPDPIGTDPRTGGLRRPGAVDPQTGYLSNEACSRETTRLAYNDHEYTFRELLQRANRSNVSFYPIDARGLIAFDTPIQWAVPPGVDAANMSHRFDHLRSMASQTDGEAVLNASDVTRAARKIFADVGSYYLLGYYSTNPKLDGRFRRIRVEVKRPEVEIRARPGYLAPTEAEARAAGAALTRAGEKPGPPSTVTRALDAIAQSRGNLPARVQAAGGHNTIRTVIELDAATAKRPEWSAGGDVKVTFEPERGAAGTKPAGESREITLDIAAGARSVLFDGPDAYRFAPGRYAVRAQLTPRNGRIPIQVTTFATIPPPSALVGTGAVAARRGPSTGLAYMPTADPRFRRTERLRIEAPVLDTAVKGAGRILTREGQATPLVVTVSVRTDESRANHLAVADVALAPLAAGEYVLELAISKDGKTETVSYGFRIVP
ncbi:MAG TPA: VWA domain-containing protein [Vicinamibacterales bacterium]|nr:VWA domain-containing protein [Vicinamibacterales bacterium]